MRGRSEAPRRHDITEKTRRNREVMQQQEVRLDTVATDKETVDGTQLADARERVDTRETAREIAEAEEAACRDQEFLDPGKDEEDQGRRESEAEQERHRSRIRASRRP